jgi:broad specificity phosphatase PhoE
VRLYLLRHGEVSSHQGDVPITRAAERQAYEAGRRLAGEAAEPLRILTGETRRAVDTAAHLARGVVDAGGRVVGPEVAFALRNPDLYLSGVRVNMVSSTAAFAEQVEGVAAEDVAALDFFPEFIASPDRIGWWLTLESPPGEDAAALAQRVRAFATSLADPVPGRENTVVAVTHSPLIRAAGLDFLGEDIGEPPWVTGLLATVDDDGAIRAEVYEERDR